MEWPRLSTFALAFLLLLVACTSGADQVGESPDETLDEAIGDESPDETLDETTIDDGSSPLLVDVDDIDGTSWTLMFGGSATGEIASIEGWPITMTFDGFNLSGTAACNGYGASFSLDGPQFVITEIGSEDAGCDPAVQEAERLYLLALQDIDGINLMGDELALSGATSELIFRRNSPTLDGVTGTLWLLEAELHDGVETAVAGEPATLMVEPGGWLSASTGCRTSGGAYVVSGNEIILTNFSASGQCPTSLRAQDNSVVSVLLGGFVPVVDGDQLLVTSQGNQGLRYRATTEAEVASLPPSTAPSDADLLDGVEWVFTSGSGADGPIADPRSVGDQRITFIVSNGTFSGMANCNAYTGEIEVGSGQWTLTEAASEKRSCGPELDVIAAKYLAALPLMMEFGFDAGVNQLTTNGSDAELSFERAE